MVFLVEIIQSIQQQVFVDEDLPLTVRLDHLGVPAGHHDRRHGFGLGLHALDHAVDHGGVAVEDAGAHGVDGGAAKDGGGAAPGRCAAALRPRPESASTAMRTPGMMTQPL